jgi:predicted Zn-dependent protease
MWAKRPVALFVAGICASACATSPLGRKQLILLPDSQLTQMGVATYREYKKEVPASRDAATKRYVECVARAITVEARQGAVPEGWEVTVFEDDDPNAFAIPGGKIGVNTGLLEVAKNQDQLAAVVGHEVAHVLARHSNERASAEAATQVGLGALSASGAVQDPRLFALFGLGSAVGITLPYSRTHESEADLYGLDLMASAGFDPRQSVELWQNMARAGGERTPDFLSTHPGPDTRIEDLRARIPQALPLYEQAVRQGKRPKCR